MTITINESDATIALQTEKGNEVISFSDPKAFETISRLWLRLGWDTKYVYTFSWLGRPIIQLPEDLLRIQEVIYSVKPDLIIETGVAHGGGVVFFSSLLKMMNISGKVLGVDIEIREHNRDALEKHELRPYYELIEGSSTSDSVIKSVAEYAASAKKSLVVLDSNHTKDHVYNELLKYSKFVTPGSYIIVADGIMKDLVDAPRSQKDWRENNPYEAIQDFLSDHKEFSSEQPLWLFNESEGLSKNITYWPSAYLKRTD